MIKPEEKSDLLDLDIANFVRKDAKRRLWINITLVFIIVLSIVQSAILLKLGSDNHKVLTAELPGLQKQIEDRDKSLAEKDETIKDQTSVITQAVDWILKLTTQIKELGGDPPEIILKPQE